MIASLLVIFLAIIVLFPSAVYLWSKVLIQSFVFIILAVALIPTRNYFRKWESVATAFLIYVIFSAFSIFNAVYLNGSWLGWLNLFIGFLIYWLSSSGSLTYPIARQCPAYEFIGYGLILLGILEAGYGIYQYVYGFKYTIQLISQNPDLISTQYYTGILHALQTHRIIGTFGNPNVYALFLAMILPISTYYFLNSTQVGKKTLLLIATGILLTALAFTYSRGGYLCSMFGLIPLIFLFKKQINLNQLFWICSLIIISIALITICSQFPKMELQSEKLETFSSRLTKPTSTVSERFQYWNIAKQMISDHPFVGTGIGSFAIRYGKYKPVGVGETKYAHNLFLQIWVEQGLLGLLSFIGLMITLVYFTFRYLKKTELNLAYALSGSLFAFITDGFFGFGYYTLELFYLFCCILGVYIGSIRPSKPQSELEPQKPSLVSFVIFGIILLILAGVWYFAVYSPYLGQLYFNTALTRLKEKQLVSAVAGYKAALVCDPMNSEYHQHLGNTLLQLNAVEQGIRHLELAVKLNPNTAYYHSDLAEAYRAIGRYPEAEREAKLAIAHYPNKPAYHYQLAQIYAEQGKEALATAEMLKFAELSKNK
ncbi:MAG: O-antigen ligase family protein [bacterium]|nr:O-antigen ligase family protein [bacterium]